MTLNSARKMLSWILCTTDPGCFLLERAGSGPGFSGELDQYRIFSWWSDPDPGELQHRIRSPAHLQRPYQCGGDNSKSRDSSETKTPFFSLHLYCGAEAVLGRNLYFWLYICDFVGAVEVVPNLVTALRQKRLFLSPSVLWSRSRSFQKPPFIPSQSVLRSRSRSF